MKSGERIPTFCPNRPPEEDRHIKLIQCKYDANTVDPVSFQPLQSTKHGTTKGFITVWLSQLQGNSYWAVDFFPLASRSWFLPWSLAKLLQLKAYAFLWYGCLSSSFPAKMSFYFLFFFVFKVLLEADSDGLRFGAALLCLFLYVSHISSNILVSPCCLALYQFTVLFIFFLLLKMVPLTLSGSFSHTAWRRERC